MPVYSDGREVARAVADEATLVTRGRSVPARSLTTFLEHSDSPSLVWEAPGSPTIAAIGAAATVTAGGSDRFGLVREAAADVFVDADVDVPGPSAVKPRFFGGGSFHPDPVPQPPWDGFEAAEFVLPRLQMTRTPDRAFLTHTEYGHGVDPAHVEQELERAVDRLASATDPEPGKPPGVAAMERDPDRDRWRSAVRTAIDRIQAGGLRKLVLAQSLHADLGHAIDVPSILSRLGDRHADCTRFLYAPTPDVSFFGATPERLVSRRGRTVETIALAGSIGRGETAIEDAELARALESSAKDTHEHALVVDTLTEQLDPLTTAVTTGERHVRQLDSVQHLETRIRGRLARDYHVLSLVDRLHPTPAVGGLPPEAAQRAILDAESFDRGWYAGPIGWFDARGNGEFAVGIRSAVAGDRSAVLFAGAGIVADSDPETEWEEVQLKYRPVLDALER